jgi:hypothetical protein
VCRRGRKIAENPRDLCARGKLPDPSSKEVFLRVFGEIGWSSEYQACGRDYQIAATGYVAMWRCRAGGRGRIARNSS